MDEKNKNLQFLQLGVRALYETTRVLSFSGLSRLNSVTVLLHRAFFPLVMFQVVVIYTCENFRTLRGKFPIDKKFEHEFEKMNARGENILGN